MFPDAVDGTSYGHSWPDRPKDCFLHSGGALHWNPHATGSKNSQDQQICLSKSVQIKLPASIISIVIFSKA